MKKKELALLMAVTLMAAWIPIPAYGANSRTEESGSREEQKETASALEFYSTVLKVPEQPELEVLTLEKAIEKAMKYSSSIRNSKRDLEELQKERDKAAEKWTYSSTNSLSEIMSILSYDTQLVNSQLSQEVTRAKLENSMKSAYISIINAERKLALNEMELQNSKNALTILSKKADLGLVTEQELENETLSYEKKKTEMETLQKSLDQAYISLNALIGEDSSKRYQVSLEPIYEQFSFKGDLETYITNCLANNSNIKQKENAWNLAKEKLKLFSIESGQSYTSLQNDVSTSSLSYRDAKTELETSIRSTYNNITNLEQSYSNNLKELEVLKKDFIIAETQHQRKLITDLELEKARYSVASMENTILGQIYEHMLLVEQFENSDLL